MSTTEDPALLPRLAATAPPADDDGDDDQVEAAGALEGRPDLHALCEAWSSWCRTRCFYVKPSLPVSVLGKLRQKGPGGPGGDGPNATASAEIMAFHLACVAQPADALDRRVFELHYYWRVRNVKAAALELGISRQHWYRLVNDFRERVYRASQEILQVNLDAAAALPSRVRNTLS